MNYVGLEDEYTVFQMRESGSVSGVYDALSVAMRFGNLREDMLLVDRETATLCLSQGVLLGVANIWLANGGRIYMDRKQLEYASPECLTVEDVVLADKAGEAIIDEFCAGIDAGERFYAMKRSATKEVYGVATWGGHESYTVPASEFNALTDDSSPQNAVFKAFLASRQIFTGCGHIGYIRRGQERRGPLFLISPRMEFISSPESNQGTTGANRSLINTRDESWMNGGNMSFFKRLHLISGEMNRSDWSIFLKVGVTALILKLLHIANRDSIKYLIPNGGCVDLLRKAKVVSDSYNGAERGREFEEFLGIQSRMRDVVWEHKDEISEEVREFERIFSLWTDAISAVSGDARQEKVFSRRLDFLIKKRIIEEKIGGPVSELRAIDNPALLNKLLSLDFSYCHVGRKDFYRGLVESGFAEEMFGADRVAEYCFSPPRGRAERRVKSVRYAAKTGLLKNVNRFNWDALCFLKPYQAGHIQGEERRLVFDERSFDELKSSIEAIKKWIRGG